jgi:hypothetical protein
MSIYSSYLTGNTARRLVNAVQGSSMDEVRSVVAVGAYNNHSQRPK